MTDGAIGAPEQGTRAATQERADDGRPPRLVRRVRETIPEGEEHRALYLLHPLSCIIVMLCGPGS
ncbi:hypothetical protein [Humibacter ginsenosidimutans]|uniref:hypothetical protein n=1 Tax=Humibacter ginsenosidimutans TaxID=2599293 RepID=UPI00143D3054|nr:hypothetical protein [Humibacter ginsenosidimutans]